MWLCGISDMYAGDTAIAQTQSCLQNVDNTLATVGLHSRNMIASIHTHTMVSTSLPNGDLPDVLTRQNLHGLQSRNHLHGIARRKVVV